MDIDRQRIAAVRALEALGYSYRGRRVVAAGLPIARAAARRGRRDAWRPHATRRCPRRLHRRLR
jgi:hypothetical protein